MSAFQREVGAWAQQTFPQSTRESVLAHLYDELQELMAADQGEQAEGHTEIEEAADCYLLLLHYAHKCRFDLEESAMLKHLRNTRRQWGVPDERGVVRHVVEGIQA